MIFKFIFHIPGKENHEITVSGGSMPRGEVLARLLTDIPLGQAPFTRIDVEEVPPLTEEDRKRAQERIRTEFAEVAKERGTEPPEIEFT